MPTTKFLPFSDSFKSKGFSLIGEFLSLNVFKSVLSSLLAHFYCFDIDGFADVMF